MDEADRCDVAIVGAGLVGLATAYQLARLRPGLKVAVLDKEPTPAAHQSTHNSGVIHSGLYYKPGSLKARLCREGREQLMQLADTASITIHRSGKLVVAVREPELPRLVDLKRNAEANGLQGVAMLDSVGIAEHEPQVTGLGALWIPETAVIDYGQVAAALCARLEGLGVPVLTNHRVHSIREVGSEVAVSTSARTVLARYLINSAGLYSDRIARLAGIDPGVMIIPFRGDYFDLGPEAASRIRGLVYPVPDPNMPFLGVHLTRSVHGNVSAGPNAVLALSREGYRRSALTARDAFETLTYRGFWALALRNKAVATQEVWGDLSRRAYTRKLRPYIPWIVASDLRFGPSGVRAQAVTADGRLVDDFYIKSTRRSLHVLNAPSPAATACLGIGKFIADEAVRTFDLHAGGRG